MRYLYLSILAFSFSLSSCHSTKIVNYGVGQTFNKKKAAQKPAIIDQVEEMKENVTIKSIQLSGNILTMDITYKGGCLEPNFELVGSPMLAKSMPPIRRVVLKNTESSDNCEATVNQKLVFDLSNLAYQQEDGSEIILNIDGITENLRYTYTKK